MKPHLMCDIDGVLTEFVDLTGASDLQIFTALDNVKLYNPSPRMSLYHLRDRYTITFATARKHISAVGSTYEWMKDHELYYELCDNLIVGATTNTKPYLAFGMQAKAIIDDHPKVIDLMYQLGWDKYCVPIYIKRGRESMGFPLEADTLVEATEMLLNNSVSITKSWSIMNKILDDMYKPTEEAGHFVGKPGS